MNIEHIAICTKNLVGLKQFYTTYFDARPGPKYFNPVKQFESCFLSFATGARLELMYMPSVPASRDDVETQITGIIHFAFSTGSEEQVDVLTLRLKKDGFRILDGPRRTGDGYYESVVLDPDGNRVEITV